MNEYSYEHMKGMTIMKEDGNSREIELCDTVETHENLLGIARKVMPEENLLYDLADLFKLFGDSTRIKILYALYSSEMCVCDLADLLGMNQSAISHQLKTLKQAKLVKFRREGKSVFYSLDDDHIVKIINQGMAHIMEDK